MALGTEGILDWRLATAGSRDYSRHEPTRFPYTPGCFSKNGSVLATHGASRLGVALCQLGDTTGQVPEPSR